MDTTRALRRLPVRAQEIKERSRLLDYLPGFFADDCFLNGFLWIFQSIWDPLERQIDQLYTYFDPRLAPEDMIPWLGTWVDLVLDENWPPERRRLLIQRAADLYRRRGTVSELRDYLEIFTGVVPLIIDQSDDPVPFHFMVVIAVEHPGAIDEERVRHIIESEKPAHTTYTLCIEATDGPHSSLSHPGTPGILTSERK